MKTLQWTAALVLMLPLLAAAQAPATTDESSDIVGVQTRQWLDLQASNRAAAATARPMSGEVADQVFDRYAKSFGHPIPEAFNRDKFVEGSGSK